MEYKLKNGKIVDDNQLEAMAAEWESGQWEGHLENVEIAVPLQEPDELVTVSFRLPRSRIVAVETAAEEAGITKSEFFRLAVDRELCYLQ